MKGARYQPRAHYCTEPVIQRRSRMSPRTIEAELVWHLNSETKNCAPTSKFSRQIGCRHLFTAMPGNLVNKYPDEVWYGKPASLKLLTFPQDRVL